MLTLRHPFTSPAVRPSPAPTETIARVRDGKPWLREQTPPYESSLPEPATPPPRYRLRRHAAAPTVSSSRAGAIRARGGCRKLIKMLAAIAAAEFASGSSRALGTDCAAHLRTWRQPPQRSEGISRSGRM